MLVRSGGDQRVAEVHSNGERATETECSFHLIEIPDAATAWALIGPPPSVDAVPYRLYCGSALWGALWVTPADMVDYDQVARDEAERYVRTVLGPGLAVEHAPAAYAVTGAPSQHWVTGWDGQPIHVGPINPFGEQLDITLTLERVDWAFGDGATSAGDLGAPPPSTVRHVYVDRSTSVAAPDAAYTSTATVTIGVSYTIDGGAPIGVSPPLSAAPTAPVVVRELQAVLE